MKKIVFAFTLLCQCVTPVAIGAEVPLMGVSNTPAASVHVRSWKSLRDANIVKQNFDYSCGAASLSTIMSYYSKTVGEEELMKAMARKDGIASFADLAEVAEKHDFKTLGVALSYEQLRQLKQPAIAYLMPEREAHFTVIRGINDTHVWLGDPSWGNRVISKERFLAMWVTRDDDVHQGKILLVQPKSSQALLDGAFGPPRPNELGQRALPLRLF